ncbi:MAG: hypothetical protein WAK27_15085 [Candidatus Sulfotelmatobacter sp.]
MGLRNRGAKGRILTDAQEEPLQHQRRILAEPCKSGTSAPKKNSSSTVEERRFSAA